MMARLRLSNPARWGLLAALVGAVVLAGILLTRARALAAPDQPLEYSHRTHVQAGIQCLFCHSGALRSQAAGIPSTDKCIGCHTVIATDRTAVRALADYASRGEEVRWSRVNDQPDFVFFSHQVHLGAGLNCESCHGEVGAMDVARPVNRMDMGWCLNCHLDQPEDKVARLTDCLACHQ